jgi:type I restriction enzyme M protein
LKEQTQLGFIQSKILRMLDIFHGENISVEDYFVALLFLSLGRAKILGVAYHHTGNEFYKHLEKALKEYGAEESLQFSPIIPHFEEPIKKLSHHGLNQLIFDSNGLISRTDPDQFSEIFDQMLYAIAKGQGRLGGEIVQPVELTRLLIDLADLPENAKVFNPFAGLASFGIFLGLKQEFYGQEINPRTWAIGQLRLMAYDRTKSSRFVCEDSIANWPTSFEKFDLVISHPPFNLRISREIDINNRTADQLLVNKGISSLAVNGKLIAVLPQQFLNRGSIIGQGFSRDQAIQVVSRKTLVDEDLLDTIISLPAGLFSNTGINTVILVISIKKKYPNKTRFINGNEFVKAKNLKEKILNVEELTQLIRGPFEDSEYVRVISSEVIEENNYILDVPRYFQKTIIADENEQLVKLKDILEYVRGKRGDLPERGKLVRVRDLKNDRVDFQLDFSNLEEIELRYSGLHQLNESCILLAIRWRALKPTYFRYSGQPLFRNQDILSFKLNESIADYRYVINELQADYVTKQLESYRTGATIPFIRKDDLLEVKIKLPSLEEQRAKIQGVIELSEKIKVLQDERNALEQGVSEKLFESVSNIKHSLGKPLLNIGSSLRNIEKALSRLNSEWQQIKLNDRYDITIKDSFDSIYSNLELIHSVLRNNEQVLDVSNYEVAEIDFLAFIKGYVKRIKSAERSNVNTKIDIHPDIKIQLKNRVLVQANSDLLEIALNTIVENANMHAFIDHSKKYKLEFRVSLYVAPSMKKIPDETIGRFDTYIKVEVANDGKPFPENFSLDKLIMKNRFAGETGNTGQGGFDLNEIIKYHNNGVSTLELITDDFTSEFTTTYSFLIPFNR